MGRSNAKYKDQSNDKGDVGSKMWDEKHRNECASGTRVLVITAVQGD